MTDLKTFISATLGATLGAVLSFIVCPLLSWFNHAKKDGHIDSEEIEDLTKEITHGINEIGDALDEHKKGGK